MNKKDVMLIILLILFILSTSFLLLFIDIATDQAQVIEGYEKDY